jgi:hypothetical protein
MKTDTAPGRFSGPAAGAALAAGLWLLASALLYRSGGLRVYLDRPELGSFLLAGLPNSGVTWSLPLFRLLAAAAQAAGLALPLLLGVRLALYLLTLAAGRLFGGQRGGLLALSAAGAAELSGAFLYDAEQAFYSLTLLVLLCLLALRRREDGVKPALLCGLAAGVSLLTRSPLFFFPPLLVLLDFAAGARGRAFLLRSLVLLGAAYALLLPWGFLNRAVTGRFSLLDSGRAASNLAAGAMGCVYTFNGNPLLLPGPAAGASPAVFYLRAAAGAPGFFALTALRRLWAAFLFHPALFGLFLAALPLAWKRGRLYGFALPAYFALFHALFPVEERYFYPLLWLLPPLLAGVLFAGGDSGDEASARRAVLAVFAPLLCAALAAGVLALAYPLRAASNSFDGKVPGWLAGDRTVRGLACGTLLARGDYGAYAGCLGGLAGKFGDGAAAYFLEASVSGDPASIALPRGPATECLVIRMLREFELGRTGAALAAYRLAYADYAAVHSMTRGAPYARDRELAALLKSDAGTFWDVFVYPALLRWPPERIAVILPRLAAALPADGRLRLLADALAEKKAHGGFGWKDLREWTAPAAMGVPRSSLRGLWRTGAERSAALLAAAAQKESAGDSKAARSLLERALELDLNPDSAEIYLALCRLPAGALPADAALKACGAAAYGAYFAAENGPPAAAAEAAFRAYALLNAVGRRAEARTALRRAVDNAPPDWPGLAAAEVALAGR